MRSLAWVLGALVVGAYGFSAAGCGGSDSDPAAAAGDAGDSSVGAAAGADDSPIGSDDGGAPNGEAGGEERGGNGGGGNGGLAGGGGNGGLAGAGNAPDDSGKVLLASSDGITGTVDGTTVFTRTMNAKATSTVPGIISMYADDGKQGDWMIAIPSKVGSYACENQPSSTKARISLNNQNTSTLRGVAVPDLHGGCTLEVTSVSPGVEGRFVATLAGVGGALHEVTAGYFHFGTSPVGDCAGANDPGVPAGTNGATLAVTQVEALNGSPWKCGTNGTLAYTDSTAGEHPVLKFSGKVGTTDRMLEIDGLTKVGTATCGAGGVALLSGGYGGPNGGSCTIIVTDFSATTVAGSYEAALYNGLITGHDTIHVKGSFRARPSFQ